MSVAATPGATVVMSDGQPPETVEPDRGAPPEGPARPGWWTDAVALAAALVGLGVGLMGPRLIPDTDPYGVDPNSLRLGAVSLGLVVTCLAWPRMRPGLAVSAAVSSVVLPFVLWSWAPDLVGRVWGALPATLHARGGEVLDGRVVTLARNVLYVAATAVVCAVALRATAPADAALGAPAPGGLDARQRRSWLAVARAAATPSRRSAALRLWPIPGTAVGAAVLLLLLMAVVFAVIPAMWLGRVAIPLADLRRDLPLLGPAFALQAVAQELAFRGLLLGTLERRAPPLLANAGQATLFGLAHTAVMYEGPAVAIVPVTVAIGLVLGWVTQRTRSLWPAIVVHAAIEIGQAWLVLSGIYGT